MKKLSVKAMTISSVFVSIAFVLSFIKIFSMPLGGSVTLCSMLFICLIGYMYGPKAGLISAFVYGLLQFIQKPEMYSPVQIIVDYALAFTALGLSGFVKVNKFRLQISYIVAITGRFVFSALSGYIFFREYTPEGWNPLYYTLCYNAGYIYAEGLITLIIISIPAVRLGIERIISSSQTE